MLRIDPEQLTDLKSVLQYLIDNHNVTEISKLQEYYEGRHGILSRQMADSTKPNNKLVNNLAAYITDTITGYIMGKPVSYSVDEEEPKGVVGRAVEKVKLALASGGNNEAYLEALQSVFDLNDEQDHNSELAKSASIKGAAYELLYTDEEANIRFAELPRENVIYVETDDVAAEPALAVRIYEVDDLQGGKRHLYDVYTDSEIITYEMVTENEVKSLVERERRAHYFQGVPVVAYPNNKELMGDFKGVLSLIDAYNNAQSDTANDFEYFTDAYLKLTGADMDHKDIVKMKETRVITMPDKECDADWLIKQINDVAVENYKNRVRRDIHALSKTPNLTDEQFAGQLSGVAIAYKIWGMEQISATKERKFKKGLQRRIELITNIFNATGKQWDYRDINMTFSRNMPQNLTEIVEMVQKLKSTVSDQTLLSQLPFIEDPQEEIERLEKQNAGKVDLYDEVENDEPIEETQPGGQTPRETT